MNITLDPIAIVKNSRKEPIDDYWEEIISEIELLEYIPTESFDNISEFSHLEIIYSFNKVNKEDIIFSGHPRGNTNYPKMGIFGQRKKDRPNSIGLSNVELIEHHGRIIKVKFLDAIDGTPILDIKPVFKEFKISENIKQPNWVEDLMKNYWK
jgi:tRNA-Thr(GGU) m(6)t(6)A37 methyltransferase TsaA